MEKLLIKIRASSYVPTSNEVLDGVRWLRENLSIATGIVVELTSYSVAKYYQYGEDSDEDNDDSEAYILDSRATSEEIARSVTALHLGLVKIDVNRENRRHSTITSATNTASLLENSGSLRFRTSSVLTKAYQEKCQLQKYADEQVWMCLHEGQCSPGEQCSNLGLGWYGIAANTSPAH